MESLGVNVLNSEEFCSDLIALFFKHIWECDDCYSMTLGALVSFVFAVALLLLLVLTVSCFIEKLFSNLFDRFRYKKLYDDLITKYGDLSWEYDKLSDDYSVLADELKELQKEYYHTCN